MARISSCVLICIIFMYASACYAAAGNNPMKIEIITRTDANYLTPVNTLSAIQSCLLARDLTWCDETMTRKSLEDLTQSLAEANIDRVQMFELEARVKESFIVDKVNYQSAVILIIEDHDQDGSVMQMPITFVQVNGLWKQTNKFAEDDTLSQYFYMVPPLFYGKGQKPDDVNSFMGYEQPKQDRLELEAGVASYTVHVYYSKTVDAQTFSATLNKEDISGMFSPAPYTDQEVVIPLVQGQNTLVLSIEGMKKDGKKATDKDRLVFVVP